MVKLDHGVNVLLKTPDKRTKFTLSLVALTMTNQQQ